MTTLQTLLAVSIGGAIGAPLRFLITQTITNTLGKGFPFGTLVANVVGSFLLGVLYSFVQQSDQDSWLREILGVGLLGALTTFSTFSFDVYLLIEQREYVKAILNIFLNVSCCVFAVWLAILIFKG